MEGLWDFGLEKLLSAESSVGCPAGAWTVRMWRAGQTTEACLACDVSEGHKDSTHSLCEKSVVSGQLELNYEETSITEMKPSEKCLLRVCTQKLWSRGDQHRTSDWQLNWVV